MANFTGTGADETITPAFVSPTVIRNPAGAFPGDAPDSIAAGAGNDTVDGGGGGDTIQGGGGNDTLNGGAGDDKLLGSDGLDSLSGDSGNDVLLGGSGIDVLLGGDGDDQLDGGEARDTMEGGAGNDIYWVDHFQDVVKEGVFSDGGYDTVSTDLYSYTLPDYVEKLILADASSGHVSRQGRGNAQDNEIIGSSLRDGLFGLDGNDSLSGGAGNDDLAGGGGRDTLRGDDGNDLLSGGDGDDVLDAGAGDDHLLGGQGADTMTGGAGHDRYDVENAGDVVQELGGADGGVDAVSASIFFALPQFVENLTLTGSADIAGIGNAAANVMIGNSGNNALTGLEGDDTLDGGAGADTLNGGAGNDIYVVDDAGDTVSDSGGLDLVRASVSWVLAPGLENLALTGSANIDGTGNAGDNVIDANSGNNVLDGGAGNDTASYATSTVSVAVSLATTGPQNTAKYSTPGSGIDQLIDIENLTGSNHHDTLRGNDGVNVLMGGAGLDTLEGGGGADILDGGDSRDRASYEHAATGVTVSLLNPGSNTGEAAGDVFISIEGLDGSGFDDRLIGSNIGSQVNGLGGNDVVLGGDGADDLWGGDGNDRLEGGGDEDYLVGDSGNDLLNGGAGDDMLYADDGDDRLDGNDGADDMGGGAGNDIYIVDNAGDLVSEASNSPNGDTDEVISTVTYVLRQYIEKLTLAGMAAIKGAGNDLDNLIVGNSANNELQGLGGNDTLEGGDGDDVLAGGLAADLLNGGDGFDFAIYSSATDGVIVSIAKPQNNTGEALGDSHISIEGLIGSAFDDALIGDGVANWLVGGLGADRLNGKAGIDTVGYDDAAAGVVASLTAPGGNTGEAAGDSYVEIENLSGSRFADTLTGDAGANRLDGNVGDDKLWGLAASDTLVGGTGADRLDGGDGFDYASYENATSGVTVSLGKPQNNTGEAVGDIHVSIEGLIGSAFNDALIGDGGTNWLTGGAGADLLNGKAGRDTVGYDDAAAGVVASLTAPGGNTGEAAGDTYVEIESLSGSAFGDRLTGDAGANRLDGNGGDDVLDGGAAKDVMSGGLGRDAFVFSSALAKSNVDTIVDFNVTDDHIALSHAIFLQAGAVGPLSADAFHFGTSAHDASDRIIYNQTTGALLYDPDGTGSQKASQFATVGTGLLLTASDFWIV